jgi:hypothetical protein
MIPKMSENRDDIIVFQHFDSAIDANIAKTKLDAYGIPCFLTEENMAGLYPGQSFNAFKIRLHLFATDRERASSVLMNQDSALTNETSTVCPRCQSDKITREFPKKVADQLVYVFFGIFFPHKKVNHCLDCGLEF